MRHTISTIILLSLTVVAAGQPTENTKKRPANRLAQEISPYLLQHAHNPVDWHPWGAEAFAKAKKEGKLVFLSIGYSSCHWCHVMERESFSSEEIAKLLNENFICIKVDREERPDIDHIYMTALQVFGNSGGWPLSMFLTADGKPILGGTYWPPDDREIKGQRVPGFKSVIKLISTAKKEKPKAVEAQAEELAADTVRALEGASLGIPLVELNRELVAGAVDGLKERFDDAYGGFGNPRSAFRGTKFPTPPFLLLLQAEARRTGSAELVKMLNTTLEQMALGGIYDHLGGGFHRYSTERTWTVPHFEKMLYDNAQLVEVYANAYQSTRNPLYKRVVGETLAFVSAELTSPEGGFYSALDADSEGEEGRYYVWTDADIAAVIPDKTEAALVKQVYSERGEPNFEMKYHILAPGKPLADKARELKLTEEQLEARLAPLRRKLLAARSKRERPFLDTKILAGWNGEMIAGFALAGQVLEEPKYVAAAARAAELILKKLRTPDGRLLRCYAAQPGKAPEARLNACLDDYAYVVHGLLALFDATKEARWLNEAKTLTDTMVKFYGDEKSGGFYYTSNDHEKLFARAKDQYDGAQPSGNSVAARNLVRLWQKTKDDSYRALAERVFKSFSAQLKSSPTSMTSLAEALAMYLDAKK
jgi:uncharacterized protein YyaL (SSP411 family)